MSPKFPSFSESKFSEKELEIRAWLKANRNCLSGREPGEVAYLAILAGGFDLDDVCTTLSNFTDAMQGSSTDNRAALHVWSTEMAFYRLQPKELDLTDQWNDLTAYQGGDL